MTDSTHWSEERRKAAGIRFAERLAYLLADPTYQNEMNRTQVGVDLAIAIRKSATTPEVVAERAGMSLPILYDHLSGEVNFTLDSIGRITRAFGYEFDVVLRKAGAPRTPQPWQRSPTLTSSFAADWSKLVALLPTSILPITTVGWWITFNLMK